MPQVERAGASLYYEVAGTGAPLVFCHGAGGNTLVWWQQVPYFAGEPLIYHWFADFHAAIAARAAGIFAVPSFVVSSAILIPEARRERRIRLQMPITVVAGD